MKSIGKLKTHTIQVVRRLSHGFKRKFFGFHAASLSREATCCAAIPFLLQALHFLCLLSVRVSCLACDDQIDFGFFVALDMVKLLGMNADMEGTCKSLEIISGVGHIWCATLCNC